MIKEGGIYSKNEEIRIVVEIDDEIIYYYSIYDDRLENIVTKVKIEQIIQEDWLIGFFIENYHVIFYESFKDMNDGYLGKIDDYLLLELQRSFEKIKE